MNWPCLYRGPQRELRPCETCGAGVEIRVFACRLFGSAQIQNYLPDVKPCSLCVDRIEKPSQLDEIQVT